MSFHIVVKKKKKQLQGETNVESFVKQQIHFSLNVKELKELNEQCYILWISRKLTFLDCYYGQFRSRHFYHLFLFSTDENWQSCNNPLTSMEAWLTADSAAVFTSEAMTTSGCYIMISPRPNVELSS